MLPGQPDLAPPRLSSLAKRWFERVEEIALSALDEEFDLDTLEAQLAELGGPNSEDMGPPTEAVETHGRRLAMRCDLGSAVDVSVVSPELTCRVVRSVAAAHGIWWNWGSAVAQSSVLLTEGLPPVIGFAAMPDGDWKRWGRDDDETVSSAPPNSFESESVDE